MLTRAMARRQVPLALFLGSVAYLYSSISPTSNIIVETNNGLLRGFQTLARNGRSHFAFLGIPYARAPIKEMRFEPPQPAEDWVGVRNAHHHGANCWQFERISRTVQGSEDCLFLNVFTHQIVEKDQISTTALHPVVVFIHGGMFMAGVSNFYRPKYWMEEDVVLVTLNYRLASFGFLNTGDNIVRGNMGLKDQNMALRWIQENIMYFGGDPSRVTLVGESAGATSVHLHTLSPMSKGLFHAAILQSGAALNPWSIVKTPIAQAQRFGRLLGCPTDSSKAMVACLKSRSARSIARTHIDYAKEVVGDRLALFAPTIERVNDSLSFLTEHPRILLESGKVVNPVPIIMGVNSEEGLVYAANAIKNETSTNDNWRKIAPIVFYFDDHPDHQNISDKIRKYYLKNERISMDTLDETVNMFSDRAFFEGTHDSAVLQSKHSPVYLYYYKYHGKFGFANVLFSTTGRASIPASLDVVISTTRTWFRSNVLRRERRHFGTCHGDDLYVFYNFPVISREILPGTEDYRFSQSVIKLWTGFAQRGKTSPFQGVKWNAINPNDTTLKYLALDDYPEMIDEPFAKRLEFWKSLKLN